MDNILLGIDEVGRGPWAGPLVVGAVVLGPDFPADLPLTDSKKLSIKKRTELNQVILAEAAATGLGWVTSRELDQRGMTASLQLATRRAVKQVLAKKYKFNQIVIDGTGNFLVDTPLASWVSTLKKADALVREVSAASIIAKVARDRYMVELAQKYPGYGFEKHVGYGTAVHQAALHQLGPCPEHRFSFRPIREWSAKSPKIAPTSTLNPTPNAKTPPKSINPGHLAETAVAEYLKTTMHHQILAQNYRTKLCEVDLISTDGQNLYFTEVKYSAKPGSSGSPLNRITPAKQRQMHFAAEIYLHSHPSHFQPILSIASVVGKQFNTIQWFPIT